MPTAYKLNKKKKKTNNSKQENEITTKKRSKKADFISFCVFSCCLRVITQSRTNFL